MNIYFVKNPHHCHVSRSSALKDDAKIYVSKLKFAVKISHSVYISSYNDVCEVFAIRRFSVYVSGCADICKGDDLTEWGPKGLARAHTSSKEKSKP